MCQALSCFRTREFPSQSKLLFFIVNSFLQQALGWLVWEAANELGFGKSEGLLAKYRSASRRASFAIERAWIFSFCVLPQCSDFFATGLNESKVFGGPCKLCSLVVIQCCSQTCVITRYICLIYKITASWQLVLSVSGMSLLSLLESLSRGSCWAQGLV